MLEEQLSFSCLNCFRLLTDRGIFSIGIHLSSTRIELVTGKREVQSVSTTMSFNFKILGKGLSTQNVSSNFTLNYQFEI